MSKTITGTDKVVVVFSSPAETPLPAAAGVAVVVTGSTQTKNATVHGQVTGTTLLIHNPA
jgi:hypothetical protein